MAGSTAVQLLRGWCLLLPETGHSVCLRGWEVKQQSARKAQKRHSCLFLPMFLSRNTRLPRNRQPCPACPRGRRRTRPSTWRIRSEAQSAVAVARADNVPSSLQDARLQQRCSAAGAAAIHLPPRPTHPARPCLLQASSRSALSATCDQIFPSIMFSPNDISDFLLVLRKNPVLRGKLGTEGKLMLMLCPALSALWHERSLVNAAM